MIDTGNIMLREPAATCFRSARDAIRWLERELERGHKGIRAQERAEVGSLPWPAPTRRQEGRSRYEVREYTGITLEAVLRIRI